jgi:hypothetical protein
MYKTLLATIVAAILAVVAARPALAHKCHVGGKDDKTLKTKEDCEGKGGTWTEGKSKKADKKDDAGKGDAAKPDAK